MSKNVKILLLPHPVIEIANPWRMDVVAAIDDRHDISIYDIDKPLAPQFEGVDIVIDHGGVSGTREMADIATGKIKLWQILGTGLDHFDMVYWRKRKIPVANCPGPFSAVALAECAVMFILMLARQYNETQLNLRKGKFYRPVGKELDGLKLGLVGFGASAIELARRALPFGMKISAIDIREVDEREIREFGLEFVGKPDELDKIIADSDVISMHLHLNRETRHIIDARRFSLMKPTAFFINVARGGLADEEALTQALSNGKLGGAGLDAYSQEPPDINSPLFNLPNVITTNHISGVTGGTSRKRAAATARNVEQIAAGNEPMYRVDL